MESIVLILHLLIAIGLVGVVLLQRSEGGALGMGGGSGGGGGMGGLMSGRTASDVLTRTTAILATLFVITSLLLAILAGSARESKSILDKPVTESEPTSSSPSIPQAPSVPLPSTAD